MAEFIKLFDDANHIYIVCVEGDASDENLIHAASLLPPYRMLDIRAIAFSGDYTNRPAAQKRAKLIETESISILIDGFGAGTKTAIDRATEFKHNILKLAASSPLHRK
jgi:hypothetical protein